MEEKIYYQSNKVKLCGILNKVNDDKEIVVICHARTSSKNSRPTTLLGQYLTKNYINNFRFDFIGCGESEGTMSDYTVTNMINNLNDTLSMLKEKYGYEKFILIGCSMGARIVSLVDYKKFNIIKIILWYGAFDYGRGLFNLPSKKEKIAKKNGFYSVENNWKFSYEYFLDERKYRAYKRLYKWDVPKLFVHGTKDPYVHFKSTIKISNKCFNSELLLIDAGDHGFHNEKHMALALNKTISYIKE